MKIELQKFGMILTSRPAGREAALVVQAYFKPASAEEPIEIDFTGVKVMTPSWLDEFLQGLHAVFGDRVQCLPSGNATVQASLQAIG